MISRGSFVHSSFDFVCHFDPQTFVISIRKAGRNLSPPFVIPTRKPLSFRPAKRGEILVHSLSFRPTNLCHFDPQSGEKS